jgi:hypothetical protein
MEHVEWVKHTFVGHDGMICVEIPKQDRRKQWDPDYTVIEGTRLWIARWELCWEGFQIDCRKAYP